MTHVKCDRIGGCLKEACGPTTQCKCDWASPTWQWSACRDCPAETALMMAVLEIEGRMQRSDGGDYFLGLSHARKDVRGMLWRVMGFPETADELEVLGREKKLRERVMKLGIRRDDDPNWR